MRGSAFAASEFFAGTNGHIDLGPINSGGHLGYIAEDFHALFQSLDAMSNKVARCPACFYTLERDVVIIARTD
jgi:hypothetical protein